MSIYFGTDGIRGRVGEEITCDLCERCGRALASIKEGATIVIGRDTRDSGKVFSLAFSLGAVANGAKVTDVGVCPTAGISFVTRITCSDYGVVVTASHNDNGYNGIKIFNNKGEKIDKNLQQVIEEKITDNATISKRYGEYITDFRIVSKYVDTLKNNLKPTGYVKRVVLDCANGASYKIASEVFSSAGVQTVNVGNNPNGTNINDGCGATNLSQLLKVTAETGADLGFAFDGDADRLIVCDNQYNVYDGDAILYVLANYYKKIRKLSCNVVVGTDHTNMAIEEALNNKGIKLLRSGIGDAFVYELMKSANCNLGGEKAGHVILLDKTNTGDGVLTATEIFNVVSMEQKPLACLFDVKLYPNVTANVTVKRKNDVIRDKKVLIAIENARRKLNYGRVFVRASGTEPKVRITVESRSEELNKECVDEVASAILSCDGEYLCVE